MRSFLRKWKKNFVFAAVLSCFINILQLTFAFYMFAIYRSIVASHSELSLYTITIIALYALVCLVFFNYLRIKLLNTASVDLDQSLGDTVFKNVIKGFAAPGKRAYTQGLNDLATLKNYFNNPGIYALFDAPWAPLYLLLIYFFHPMLGLVATIGAAVIFGLSLLQDRLTRDRLVTANIKNNQNSKMVDTMLRNAEAVNSMGMEHNICNRWEQINEDVITNQTIASRRAGVLQSVTKPLQVFMQVLMYGIGAYYALLGQLPVGLMVAASIIMGQAVGPIMRAMGAWRFTLQAKAAYGRLNQFLETIDKQPEKMSLPRPEGRIDARKLVLKIGQVHLLKNVSFALDPGELLGIIGPSGAGKSTLCRIITGVWPSHGGKIRLDTVDMFYWDQEELGKHMGYLAQEVELFEATIAKNIARMGEVDQAMVEQAAKSVHIHEWIQSLPQGYSTPLNSSDGISLSGGQRQRVGLARALYGQPSVMVFDEPNSNLDVEGESALKTLLGEVKQQRSATCAIVTHKPELLDKVDKILMLKDGQVSAFGPRDQVFKQVLSARQFRQEAV
ncbi:MAG: type I secretion system permease/ATPase [Thermodesulfobacteriota bacterium]